jgi:hypothetical protein
LPSLNKIAQKRELAYRAVPFDRRTDPARNPTLNQVNVPDDEQPQSLSSATCNYGGAITTDSGAWALRGEKSQMHIEDYARAIRTVGPKACILASDLRQPANPLHPAGLEAFFDALSKAGFSSADIDLMSKANPALVLGLLPPKNPNSLRTSAWFRPLP